MDQQVKVYLILESYIDMQRNRKGYIDGSLIPKTGYVVEMLVHYKDIGVMTPEGMVSLSIRR